MSISNFSNYIVICRKGIAICKAILVSPSSIYYVGRTPELILNIDHEMTMLSPECMVHIDSCCYTLSKQNWVGGETVFCTAINTNTSMNVDVVTKEYEHTLDYDYCLTLNKINHCYAASSLGPLILHQ